MVKTTTILFLLLSIAFSQTERWIYRYHQFGQRWDDANAVVYSQDGNIYAAGYGYAESALWRISL